MGNEIFLRTDTSVYVPLKAPFAPRAGRPLFTLLGLLVAGCRVDPDDSDFSWFFEWQTRFDGSLCGAIDEVFACLDFNEESMSSSEDADGTWMKQEYMIELVRKFLYSAPNLGAAEAIESLDVNTIATCLKAWLYALESSTKPGDRVGLAAL